MRNAYNTFVTRPDLRIAFGTHKWKSHIEMDVEEIWCEEVD